MHEKADGAVADDAAIRVWVRLVRAYTRLMTAIEADLKAAELPPLAWYDALLELRRAGEDLRPRVLQERMLLAQYQLSRLLDRLEAERLVERRPCPGDRRGQLVRITAAGRALLERMWPIYRRAIAQHVGRRMDTATARQLATLLERFGPPPG